MTVLLFYWFNYLWNEDISYENILYDDRMSVCMPLCVCLCVCVCVCVCVFQPPTRGWIQVLSLDELFVTAQY
jgi:hypothetical protein